MSCCRSDCVWTGGRWLFRPRHNSREVHWQAISQPQRRQACVCLLLLEHAVDMDHGCQDHLRARRSVDLGDRRTFRSRYMRMHQLPPPADLAHGVRQCVRPRRITWRDICLPVVTPHEIALWVTLFRRHFPDAQPGDKHLSKRAKQGSQRMAQNGFNFGMEHDVCVPSQNSVHLSKGGPPPPEIRAGTYRDNTAAGY